MDDLMPWSQQAEDAIIGGLLLENKRWDAISHLLIAEHFYSQANAKTFAAISSLITSEKPADVITVNEQLKFQNDDGYIDLYALADLASQSYVPSERSMESYAQQIIDKHLQRGLLAASDAVRSLAIQHGLKIEERISQSQAQLAAIQPLGGKNQPLSIQSHIPAFLERLDDLNTGTVEPGISTGFTMLDSLMGGGFKSGKQIIVAARPSVGKSSFAEQLCINIAQSGHGVAFLSQEMSGQELTERAVANIGRIRLDNIQTGKLEDHEWGRLTDAMEAIKNLPMFFDDQPSLTLFDIQSKARALKRSHNIKVLVIDYIQLCSGVKDSSRHHQIEELSRGLKGLAKQLEITIITLSQLNREVEKRTSGKPVLSDLKESGSIEEDADVVMLLSRNTQNPQIIHCDMPKNRQGKVGHLTLNFDGSMQRWDQTTSVIEFKSTIRKHYSEDL